MAYELFERVAVRVDTPVLSVAVGGRVAFNAAACRLLRDAGIGNVVILWDRKTRRMAVKAAPKGEKNSFTITFTGGDHSASVAAKSFFNHVGWKAPRRETLATSWNAKDKMFEVTLPQQHLAAGSDSEDRRHRVI